MIMRERERRKEKKRKEIPGVNRNEQSNQKLLEQLMQLVESSNLCENTRVVQTLKLKLRLS